MKKYLGILGKLLVLAIFALAIWLLYQKLRSYSLHEIKLSLNHIPVTHLALSFGLMILNYGILIGYDWLALKAIHKKLGMSRVCMVSFVGCVISYNFGALLGGSTVRYRLYSAWGFGALDIVRLVLMLAVTFWVGAMGLAGVIFLFAPPDIPAGLGIGPAHIRPLGAALLGLCLLYLIVCWWARGRAIRIFGKEFALPTLSIAVAQTVVAGCDLVAAASCLYALLPSDSGVSFLEFLPGYLLAQVTVVLTHVPGGMGVLEVILINLLHGISSQTVFAAILAFRVIYYLLPLMLTAVLLGCYEIYLRRHDAGSFHDASRWLQAWLPTLLAYAVFVAGAVLCLSVVIPLNPRYLLFLRNHIPLWCLEGAHMLTGLVGVLLLVLAYALELRKRAAWRMVVGALCVGIVGNLCKGGDWPEALLLLAVLFPLLASRRSFGRIAPIGRREYPIQWAMAVALVVSCAILLGVTLIGLPPDSDFLLRTSYLANGPRILRTLTAELVFLVLLIGLYARRRKRC
ncbi:MAG: lysylphosphatidylglycerol synthetase family protein [Desulfovibrionaceae bacterium]|nr:lysylphosphatidylglycerol synthetase family protein [Desulfovibrionaceae bacterium]